MCLEVVWYGERGIINALITDLASRVPPSCAGRALVESIQWAGEANRTWINAITSVTCIVEVDLHRGGFGSPDLILVAETEADSPHVLFVEAKSGGYIECAMPNNPGMMVPGFNSSINGQLSLKYRFAKALQAWDGNGPVVAEPNPLRLAYARPAMAGGLGDVSLHVRHLQKPSVLAILKEHEMFSLPEDRYHFVALTGDARPFWEEPIVREANLLPVFLQPLPEGGNRWTELLPYVGWLGYQTIAERLQPGLPYQRAVATMAVEGVIAAAGDVGVQGPCNRLLHRRLTEFALITQQFRVPQGVLTSTIRRLKGQQNNLIARISNRTYAAANHRPSEELFELAPAFSQALGPMVQNGRVAIPDQENPQFVEQIIHALEQVL